MNTAGETTVLRNDLGTAGGLDILDILLVLVRRRRTIIVTTLSFFCLGLLIAYVTKPKYTATAVIMPPQQQSSSSALLSQLGSLSSLGGGAAALGLKTPADLYIGILQSRTIADAIIAKFNLQQVYHRKFPEDTRQNLKMETEIDSGKDGLINIAVTDQDPQRASDLANAYITELYRLNADLAIAEAKQRRDFFDLQLEEERKLLADAEEKLREMQQRTGIIQLNGQAQMIIQTISQLRAQIASREATLHSLQAYEADENPSVVSLRAEIAAMRDHLSKLENDQQRQSTPGDISVPSGRVAEDALEYTRRAREVKYHETLFDLLSRQFEAARIDEAKSAPVIGVIDHADVPKRKSAPKRLLMSLGFLVVGLILSSGFAFAERGLHRMQRVPEQSAKLVELRSALRLDR